MIGAMVLGAERAARALSAVLGGVGAIPPAEPAVEPAAPAPAGPDGYLAAGVAGPVPLGPAEATPAEQGVFTVADRMATRPVDALGPLLFLTRPKDGYYRFSMRSACPACGNDCTWLAMRLDAGGKDLTWWDFGGDCGCPMTVDLDALMRPATAVAMKP